MQNRLLRVAVENAILRIVFDAKSTSTSRSGKCNTSNRFRCKIFIDKNDKNTPFSKGACLKTKKNTCGRL